MATKEKIQPDYGGAFDVFYQQLQRESKKYQIPVIENGAFTGQFYDSRLGELGGQPEPKRLMEHIDYLRHQGVNPLRAGQPIPDFETTDPYESKGLVDSITNVLKSAYNKSLTNLVGKAFFDNGQRGFDVEGFRPNKVEDIASEVLSFFSPLDLVALIGGGGIGGFAVKGLAKKAIAKAVAKGLTGRAAEEAVAKSLIQIIPRSAGALGIHSGASQALLEKVSTGELKLDTFLEGVAKGGLLGAIVGGTGGASGLLTESLSKPLQIAIGLTAETVALGGASPFIFEGRAPKLDDFEKAAEFIVGLKLVGGVASKANSAFRAFKQENPEKAESQKTTALENLQKVVGDKPTNDTFNEALDKVLQKEVLPLLLPETITRETKVFGKGFTARPAAKEKFLRSVGSEQIDRQLKQGATVEMTGERAGRIFGEEALKGRQPANVLIAQAEDGGKVLLHEIFKSRGGGKRRAGLNILSVDNVAAFERALRIAEEQKKPLSISTELKNSPLFQNLQKQGLIGEVKEGDKFVKVKPPEQVLTDVTRESFKKQMARAVPEATPEQIEATMAIVDARAESAGLKTDDYLRKRFPVQAIISKSDQLKKQLAQTQFLKDGKAVITAFKQADVSSMVHELAHVFRRDLTGDELSVAAKWAGAKEGKWNRVAEEKFARGFEKYLREGEAPTPQLKTVFEKFKDWLTRIYQKLNTLAFPEITPEIRSVYNLLLSPEIKSGQPSRIGDLSASPEAISRVKTEKAGGIKRTAVNMQTGATRPILTTVDAVDIQPQPNEVIVTHQAGEIKDIRRHTATVPPVTDKVRSELKAKIAPKLSDSGIEQTLFQERVNAQKLGSNWVDRVRKTLDSIIPEELKRVSKRVKEPESVELIDRAKKGTFIHAQLFNAFEEETIRLGLDKIKTREAGEQLGRDIREGKATGYNKLTGDVFSRYKEAGGEAGEVTPETAGEYYFRRQLKEDIHQRVYEELDALKKDLGDLNNATDQKILSALEARSKEFQQGINHLLEKGGTKSLRQLLLQTERDLTRRFTTDAGWEKERTIIEWPEKWYETDARKVLPQYLDSMAKRIAELLVFGPGDKIGIELLSKLENKNFEEYKVMRRALSMWSGQYDIAHGLKGTVRNLADGFAAFEVGTKIGMGFGTLLNTTQWIISFMPKLGFWNSIEAGFKIFDSEYRKALRTTGILRNSDMQALAMVLGREGIGRFGGVDLNRFALFTTKASGFSAINRANLYWAASAVDAMIPKWLERAKNGNELAQKHLGDIGIDWKKPLTEEGKQRAIFEFATNSQLQRNVFEEPAFLNDPRLRPFLLFKRFGLRQFNWIKDMMTTELSRGNYMPLIRLAVGGYLGGAAVVWGMNKIKELLSGEEQFRRDDSFFDSVIQNFSVIGSFGMMSDILEIDRISKLPEKIKFAVAPVILTDFMAFSDGLTKFFQDWERYGDGWLATKRNAYSVFNLFGSLPRQAAKQLLTPIQKERRLSYQKGQEKNEIFELLLDGKGERAGDRVANWNRANKENPITFSDVSLQSLIKYLERTAETRAGAVGEKGSKEFRQAFREEKKGIRQKIKKQLTAEEARLMKEKIKLLKEKFTAVY